MKYMRSMVLLSALGLTLFAVIATRADAAPDTVFHLTIVKKAFVPDTLTIPADETVKIMVKNTDSLPAEFESNDFHAEVVIPGKTELPVYVRPLKPGIYSFFNDFHPDSTGTLLVNAPVWLLIAFHGFRLPLELIMHEAATEGVMPPQMTFTGLNFDITTGATALLVAALSARVYADWRNERGAAAQDELGAIRTTIQAFPLIAALKEIVARATGEAGWRRQRPPLEPLTAEQADGLMAKLAAVGFAIKRAA